MQRKNWRQRPPWARKIALGIASVFAWSFVLAQPVTALAQRPTPGAQCHAYRNLSPKEMRNILGAGSHTLSYSVNSGANFPWEGSVGGVNSGNGDKLTTFEICRWVQRGGLVVDFSLNHNSESTHNSELGAKFTHSLDLYLMVVGTPLPGSVGNLGIHWGDDTSYTFANSGSTNLFTAPEGIHDSLVLNVDSTLTLTKPDQTVYHFNTAYYCDSIADPNGNTVVIAYNAGHYVTSVTDCNSRAITLGYDGSNRINSITDPLSRVWSIAYTSGNLTSITYPELGATYYSTTLSYDANHDITGITTPGSRTASFTYNTDSSIATSVDGCSNSTSYTYVSGQTTITDPNSHVLNHFYNGSGQLSKISDNSSNSWTPTYGSGTNNVTSYVDKRGKTWHQTWDSSGNRLTATDPYSNVTTWTYSSANKPLTITMPTNESVALAYDAYGNCTSIEHKNSGGTLEATQTMTYFGDGLLEDKTDSNSNETQYTYSTNGDLETVTTPGSNETQFGCDALGVCTSRIDALSRTTDYTLDAWERCTTTTYPDSSTHTFGFDLDSNLTSFVDATGTTYRYYDGDSRLTSETKGGNTVVAHSYDATGKKGLLSTTTDAGSRVLTYAYTGLNQLYSVAETAGTTFYTYDANSNQTGVTNENGSTVVSVFDNANNLSSITNSSVISGTTTTLTSYSYGYDASSRRTSCTEANSDYVTWGYDWGGRLTSESRTGASAYSTAYTLDGEGRRTSQGITISGSTATTSFTLNSDDELTATASSTGGFTNSYSYNANGEQTNRTLSGTSNTVAFDYDGQMTSVTVGGATTSYATDALGRRVSRTSGGTETDFLYDGGAVLLEKQSGTTTATYTYGTSLIRKDGETPLYDGLGSARAETSTAQAVTFTQNGDAFGNSIATTGSTGSKYGFAATSGYRNDGDAGLSKVGCRYYDPQVGSFTTRDTYLEQKPYLYCEHDPVNLGDSSGHMAGHLAPAPKDKYGRTIIAQPTPMIPAGKIAIGLLLSGLVLIGLVLAFPVFVGGTLGAIVVGGAVGLAYAVGSDASPEDALGGTIAGGFIGGLGGPPSLATWLLKLINGPQ